ncbi:MAG: hypothetical protein HY731_11555 [Candidatus Tectomicrobia bacterium]|nr:hypothetical protein [Candidatus Tectomicrobia bacterium]
MRNLGVAFVERDFGKKPFQAEELEALFKKGDVSELLNTRHALYKERGMKTMLPSPKELIELILRDPNLIRRPVSVKGEKIVIGFDEEKLKALAG